MSQIIAIDYGKRLRNYHTGYRLITSVLTTVETKIYGLFKNYFFRK